MEKVVKQWQRSRKSNIVNRFLVLLLVSFISIFSAVAQQSELKGHIVATDGTAVIGATIMVKGTTRGTVSDGNGKFSLQVPTSKSLLVISCVGYQSQEVSTANQTSIKITLKEDAKLIKDVTVTAMGIKKDTKSIGYVVQEVTAGELPKARDVNAIASLTGKVAGLTIGQSPEMLGTPQMLLRGSSDLLFVVDGVPINSDGWNLSNDDIESYTVLKGPNAAALYGFRGQNGAILITTKKGSKDGVSVEFNTSNLYMAKSFLALPKRQNEYGYGDGYVYSYGNDPFNANGSSTRPNVWGPRFEGQPVQQYDSPVDANGVRGTSPWLAKGPNNFTNFMESGFMTSNNIALSAGGEKYDIRISVSDNYQKGMDPNTSLNINNINLYSGYQLTKKLRVDGNLNYNRQSSQNIPDVAYGPNSYTYMNQEYGSAQYDIRDFKNYWYPGYEGVKQQYAEYGRCNNPYFMANEWLRGHYKTDIYGYAKLNYEISPELTFSARTQVTGYDMLQTEKVPVSAILYGASNTLKLGQYREDRRSLNENKTDVMFLYNKNITSKIYLSALAGAEYSQMSYNSSWVTTGYLNIPNIYSFSNTLNATVPYSWKSAMNTQSAFYSADFSYAKYATLSVTGRYDKISTLPKGKNGFFYPSLSLSTVVSDYITLPKVISMLKFRGSYADVKGALSKSKVGPAWSEMGAVNPSGYGSGFLTSYGGPSYTNQTIYTTAATYNNQASASLSNTIANENLKPFSVTSYEAGADIQLFSNRLGLDVTYFTTTNGPQIYQWDVAPSIGFDSKMVNGVTTQKNGWELTLNANPIKSSSGFNWNISANWSTYNETLKELYGGAQEVLLNDHYYKVGDRLDAYYGYSFYHTPNGQIINDSKGLPLLPQKGTNSKSFLGYLNNDFAWGISNSISYKAVTLNFSFDGRVGGVIHDQVYSDMMQSGNAIDLVQGEYGAARLAEWNSVKAQGYTGSATPSYVGKGVALSATSVKPTFDANGKISNYDKLTLVPNTTAVGVKSYVTTIQGFPFQEPYMVSKTYAKLRDVSLTYNIPPRYLGKLSVKRASISITGKNLLYITKSRKDFDLDQYATGFDISKVGQKTATLNSGSFATESGAKELSQGANAQMQTPSVREYGFSLNVVF
jgi:TonB-linked SusC/RagA family outer membrane protein